MKQTAVEWLVEQLSYLTSEGTIITHHKNINEAVEQAKEMEKEQMKIYQIDKELFKKLPIEGVNCTSFNVHKHRYFATKYYIDNFKDNFKPEDQ